MYHSSLVMFHGFLSLSSEVWLCKAKEITVVGKVNLFQKLAALKLG